jgi:glycosyltransferase involved in cell wall biosynthesis
MAAGKPVVASNVDGIPIYVRDGETGLLFRSEDVQDLASKLGMLLADPVRAAAMGQRGAALVRERYSESAYADSFYQMVMETIGQAAERPHRGASAQRDIGSAGQGS